MNIYKIGIAASMLAVLVACGDNQGFKIKGKVSGAEGHTLYLSNVGLQRSAYIDSVELDADGDFEFTASRPESFDFYRLQLDKRGRQITLAIDSTETVEVVADADSFADSCAIAGSDESVRIKELAALELALQTQVDMLVKNSSPAIGETRKVIYNIIDEFKKNICKEYIASRPDRPSAYYALYMRLNNAPLFDPLHNRFDSRCFSAVATGLNQKYPHSARAAHLYNVALKGVRATQPVTRDTIYIDADNAANTGIFDIKLPDIDGDSISLTSLKGKVVMLDFTVYAEANISARNLELREIYDKYRSRGFEIFQISLDDNEHFWKTSADNLPWICVRDANGPSSYNAVLYRVDKLPTYFLINRANEVVLRDVQVEDIEKSIEELLSAK